MADERYQWLDQEAAERLLRGEPVDAVDDHARSQAERLAGALDAARTPAVLPAAHAELPGEAAALAAFRKAAAERAAAPVAAGPAGRTERAELGRVRLAAVPSSAPSRRWGRSFRYGLAAAVAAVTVGGVAVAAGTGVLPMVGPAPASSVTAGETTDPLVSEDPGIRQDPETPPTRPGGDDPTPGASPTAGDATGTTAPPTGGPDGHGTETRGPGTPKPGTSTPGASTDTTGTGPGGTSKESGGTGGDPGGTKSWERVAKACREYRSGKLDATGRQGLMNTLRAGETLRRYCDRILGGATSAPEDGGKDSGKDDSKDSDGDAKDDGKPGDGRDGDRGDSGGDTGGGGTDRRDTALPSAPDSARLTAVLPLGIGVTARVPLPV
ncbi:hypothetical protein [Streptomyces sp. NBC_00572]|uniref:hypothetical protein n=1 Tax=Streptomyces sp. NBC_00572 TaxID=2903664 RepID=UPI00225A038E|nr:hypothetical protein [Streptomyces sp. NBC_00572]MCX4982996.1 hypothetical protein [Streptomyces sp. NBC_00572]